MNSSIPDEDASSNAQEINGLLIIGSISLGTDLVIGRKRVPKPAIGKTAFLIFL